MKFKKFLLPSIFFGLTIITYIIVSVFFCYTTKPEVCEGEFPFSITYEYKGEAGTISGIYKCKFSGSKTIHAEHERYWDGESIIEGDGEYDIPNVVYQDNTMTLAVFENLCSGYFMGDPLYKDWYSAYGHDGPYPDIEYYDYENEISLDDENRDEILEAVGFKITEFTYSKPIKNSFSYSGIRYAADNIIIFNIITLVFLLLCVIFVRKDKDYQYSKLDKNGIILNFLIGILVLPFVTILCTLFGIVESNIELINQIVYNVPPILTICLALSVVFRRKGMRKTGFYIQFFGVVLFAAMLFV